MDYDPGRLAPARGSIVKTLRVKMMKHLIRERALMEKEKRIKGTNLTDMDIEEYCKSVQETLARINDRCRSLDNLRKNKSQIGYCLEDILYSSL